MSRLFINTGNVEASANRLKTMNVRIRDRFADVDAAIRQLAESWDGPASEKAVRKYNSMKADFKNARYEVFDSFVTFMLNQAGAGYEQTEEANKKTASALADRFK